MSTNQSKLPERLKASGSNAFDEDGDLRISALKPKQLGGSLGVHSVSDEELAAAIVTRYNSHDALLSALEYAQKNLQKEGDMWSVDPSAMRTFKEMTEKALALAAERGEG